jgi:diguanylate cyclase (GGDEF)-like protein
MPLFGGEKQRTAPAAPATARPVAAAAAASPAPAGAAPHDALTGLLASHTLAEECARAIEAANGGEQVAFGFIAFDGLREHTEHSGALVTDHLIRELANRMRATIRECDFVGHVNRDEFLIIFRQLRGKLETLTLIARLRITLAEPIKSGKGFYRPVVNCGLAYPPADGTTREALTDAAERAMLTMREQARETMRREAEQRVVTARAAVVTATSNVAAAEQAVRDADQHLVDSKRLLLEAKSGVTAAIEYAKSIGVPIVG